MNSNNVVMRNREIFRMKQHHDILAFIGVYSINFISRNVHRKLAAYLDSAARRHASKLLVLRTSGTSC